MNLKLLRWRLRFLKVGKPTKFKVLGRVVQITKSWDVLNHEPDFWISVPPRADCVSSVDEVMIVVNNYLRTTA